VLELGVFLRDARRDQLANELVDAIVSTPGYKTLRAIAFAGRYYPDAARIAALEKLPSMVRVELRRVELGFDEVEALKRSRRDD
jgi:hypothetical protein